MPTYSVEKSFWTIIIAAITLGGTFMNSVPFALGGVAFAVLFGADAIADALRKKGTPSADHDGP